MAKFVANCFIGVGAAIITYRAIQAALSAQKEKEGEVRAWLVCKAASKQRTGVYQSVW